MNMTFGERVRIIRKERDVSQSSLAKSAGVSQGTLSRAEDGDRPLSPDVIDKIAVALEVDPWALVRETEAEGKYARDRLTKDDEARHKANDAMEKRLYLSALHIVYARIFALFRATFSHDVCMNDPRQEVMLGTLTGFCDPWFKALERLGYDDIREQAEIPTSILDDLDELAAGVSGTDWQLRWQPMLIRGERWLVVNLGSLGGIPDEAVLKAAEIDILNARMAEWDEAIAEVERYNLRAFKRFFSNTNNVVLDDDKSD